MAQQLRARELRAASAALLSRAAACEALRALGGAAARPSAEALRVAEAVRAEHRSRARGGAASAEGGAAAEGAVAEEHGQAAACEDAAAHDSLVRSLEAVAGGEADDARLCAWMAMALQHAVATRRAASTPWASERARHSPAPLSLGELASGAAVRPPSVEGCSRATRAPRGLPRALRLCAEARAMRAFSRGKDWAALRDDVGALLRASPQDSGAGDMPDVADAFVAEAQRALAALAAGEGAAGALADGPTLVAVPPPPPRSTDATRAWGKCHREAMLALKKERLAPAGALQTEEASGSCPTPQTPTFQAAIKALQALDVESTDVLVPAKVEELAAATLEPLANYASEAPRLHPASRSMSQLCVLHSECMLLEDAARACGAIGARHGARVMLRMVIGALTDAVADAARGGSVEILAATSSDLKVSALKEALLVPLAASVAAAHPASRAATLAAAAAAAMHALINVAPTGRRAAQLLVADVDAVAAWAEQEAGDTKSAARIAYALVPVKLRAAAA